MQDDAAAAAVELEPQGAAFVPLEGLPAGRGRAAASCRIHPVRDRVTGVGGPGSRADRGDEVLLVLGGVAGSDSQPKSGPHKIACNLTLDFATFTWTGQRPP